MQISFYKPHNGKISEKSPHHRPDTYHNISNLVIFASGMVMFTHYRNGVEEIVACNHPYKIVALPEERDTIRITPL